MITDSDRLAEVEAVLSDASEQELLGTPPSAAEQRALELLDGEGNLAEIASELFLSPHTVRATPAVSTADSGSAPGGRRSRSLASGGCSR